MSGPYCQSKGVKNGDVSQRKHINLLHHSPMKARYLAALALAMAILLAWPSASFADVTSTPKPTPKPAPTQDFESEIDQYKIAIDEFDAEMKAREQILNKITQRFIAEVKKAFRIEEKTATTSANTVDAKRVALEALAQRERSVVLAASAKAVAITAMGPAPLEPKDPLKLLKSVKSDGIERVKKTKPEEIEPVKMTKSDKPRSTRKK